MQIALLLYESRVQGYRRIKELDALVDKAPTEDIIQEIAERRVLNNLCFRELEAYNRNGTFLYRHPLIIHHAERQRLIRLRKENPETFFKEYMLCKQNISRYSSYAKSDKRTEEQKATDIELLKKHQERDLIFQEVIKS